MFFWRVLILILFHFCLYVLCEGSNKRIQSQIRTDSCCYTGQCIDLGREYSNWRGRVCTYFLKIQKNRYRIVVEFFFDVIFFFWYARFFVIIFCDISICVVLEGSLLSIKNVAKKMRLPPLLCNFGRPRLCDIPLCVVVGGGLYCRNFFLESLSNVSSDPGHRWSIFRVYIKTKIPTWLFLKFHHWILTCLTLWSFYLQ